MLQNWPKIEKLDDTQFTTFLLSSSKENLVRDYSMAVTPIKDAVLDRWIWIQMNMWHSHLYAFAGMRFFSFKTEFQFYDCPGTCLYVPKLLKFDEQ